MVKRWRLLMVPLLAVGLLFSLSLGARAECTNSGACDFRVYVDKTKTKVGGDPVNISINVLDANGKVNTLSNGQRGDVLFEISSQLTAFGTIAGNAGTFASDVAQYLLPAQGVVTTNIQYDAASGTDTIRIRMYEAVSCPGAITPGQVCPGNLIKEETISVQVDPASPVVRRITNVYIGNGVAAADLTADANVGMGATVERVWGRGVAAGSVMGAEAGKQFGVHVRAPASENGKVKVAFLRVAKMVYTGGPNPVAVPIMPPEKVAEVELEMKNGQADGTFSLTKSGYYLVVAYSVDENGKTIAQLMTQDANDVDADSDTSVILMRVDPVGVPGGSPVVSQIALTADRSVLQINQVAHPVRLRVCLLDEYGNPTYATSAVTVSFEGATVAGGPAGNQIAAKTSCANWNTIAVPNSAAPISVKAKALDIESNVVTFSITQGAQLNNVVVLDEDGTTNDGNINLTAGGRIRMVVDSTANIATGSEICIQLFKLNTTSKVGDPVCSTFETARTEKIVYGDDANGDGDVNDYVVDFGPVKTTCTSGCEILIYVNSGTTPLPAPFMLLVGAAGAAVNTGTIDSSNDGTTTIDVPATMAFNGVFVAPASVNSYAMVNFLGDELSEPTFDLRNGRSFEIWGGQFICRDAYGNIVDPSNGGPQFVTVKSDNYDSSFDIDAANMNNNDVFDYRPPAAAVLPTKTQLNLNICASYADPDNIAATRELVRFAYSVSVDGEDTLKFYTNFSTQAFELKVKNIGNPYTKIVLEGPNGVTDEVQLPQNGVLPIVVETLKADGTRVQSDDNDLILHVSSSLVDVMSANRANTYTTGFQFDTIRSVDDPNDELPAGDNYNGRVVFLVHAGLNTGEVEVWVTNTAGTLESNHLKIKVQAIAPEVKCDSEHLGLCTDQESCESAGGYWYEDACHSEPQEQPEQPKPVPSEKKVGMYEGDLASAPAAYVDGSMKADFSYEDKVDVIVGVLSCDFNQIWWLGSDCQFHEDYSKAADQQSSFSCASVEMPTDAGYVFWLVTGTPLGQLDWENGAYELQFYRFGNCE